MEGLTLLREEACPESALIQLITYVHEAMDDKKGRDPASIHASLAGLRRDLTLHIMQECAHKSATGKSDFINHIRTCLVVQRDYIFHRTQAACRGMEEPGYAKTLCRGLRTMEEDILHGWSVHCCKRIKVADRDMALARTEVSSRRRRLLKPLRLLLDEESLALLALQPLKQFHSNRNAAVTVEEMERIIYYVSDLEQLVASPMYNSSGVVSGKRNRIDKPLLTVLRSSGYFTAAQLPVEAEEPEVWEVPADPKTRRSPRLLLKETIGFISALFRVFKEVDFLGNVNMAEAKRLLVAIIETPTTQQTTEEFFDKGYKNISEHTRKNLIIFLKKCIRWLESYKG
jgi:hypothetical protein